MATQAQPDLQRLRRFALVIGLVLITYSLGPCIGLILYDRLVRAGGLLHFQLPASRGHDVRARENPYMFGDIGIPLLLQKMERLGAQKDRLIVSVFGGASMMQDENIFKIGIQNTRTTKKILWQQCMSINNEDVVAGYHPSRYGIRKFS